MTEIPRRPNPSETERGTRNTGTQVFRFNLYDRHIHKARRTCQAVTVIAVILSLFGNPIHLLGGHGHDDLSRSELFVDGVVHGVGLAVLTVCLVIWASVAFIRSALDQEPRP